MQFSISHYGKKCIIKLHSNEISFGLLRRIRNIIKNTDEYSDIAINLEHIDFITKDFLTYIQKVSKRKKISLTEVSGDVYALLNLTKYNQFVDIFLSDFDFCEQKRLLINRDFSLISNY